MSLRGIKPTKVEKRLKALFYGAAGVGKTTAAINFPKVYLIDTEKGSVNDTYVDIINKNGGAVFCTTDFDELLKEVTSLLTEKHDYKTLVIDPLTILYNDLLEKCAYRLKITAKEKDATGMEFGRHYSEANKYMKQLFNLLTRLDMNVIITSHAKTEYGNNMTVLGQTFDCYKKLDYLFDLVFEIQKRGSDRIGVIKKSRIESFPDGYNFVFSYDEIANRYGKSILERDSVSEILANESEINRIKELIDVYKISEDIVQKWFDKAMCSTFEEMSSNTINKIIIHLLEKTNIKKTEET